VKRLLPITLVIVSAILFVLNLAYQYQTQEGADSKVDAYDLAEQQKLLRTPKPASIESLKEDKMIKKITQSDASKLESEETELQDHTDYIDVQPEAIESFRSAIIDGESRTPPIARREAEEAPSQEVLDDPAKYLSFQAQQRQKLFMSYITAAKPKIEKLKRLVAEGESRGISDEKLHEGRMKIQKLEEMVEQLKLENPELAEQLAKQVEN